MSSKYAAPLIVVLVLASGCRRDPPVDQVPVGSDVQLTRRDGALVEGKLTARDETAVKLAVGPATKSVPRDEIVGLRVRDEKTAATPPREAKFRELTVPADMTLHARLETAIDTATTRVETPIRAELSEPVLINGVTAIPAGAELTGNVAAVQPSAKVKGRASVDLVFDKLIIDDKSYPVSARFARMAPSTTTSDVEKIAVPAAGGAIIGGIIGGRKGAAIGAAAGAGGGTAVVLATAGKEIELPSGTVLALEAGRPIVVQVPLR